MTNRENFFRAMRRDDPQWVPLDFRLCPSQLERFRRETGQGDFVEYFQLPIRYVDLLPTRLERDFRPFYGDDLPADAAPVSWAAEWGVMGVAGPVAHFERMHHPLARMTRVEELEDYPFPDLAEPYRYEQAAAQIRAIKERDLVSVKHMKETIFEMAWFLRGMDNLMVDFFENPEFAACLLDKITAIREESARQIVRCGIDLIQLGDDVATQLDMLLSPAQWREWLKPRLARIIRAIREENPQVLIFYHSCGNIRRIIPDLIEIGVDILNPVQPECMDPAAVKKEYGDRLSLWGGLGTQTTLPFGTPETVRDTCRDLIRTMGEGGGFVLAPSHVVEPEVPWENIMAMISAHREFSGYVAR